MLTLLRSAVTDDAITNRARQLFADQVMPAVLRIGDPADAPRRAGLVATQILGLALCRYVLRFPPVVALTVDQLIAQVSPTIQRYLAGEAGGQ
jgi:hypothetical protein